MKLRNIIYNQKIVEPFNPLADFDPLYHEYSFFGVHNKQTKGHFIGNQKSKSPTITAYIALAIARTKEHNEKVTFAELFCADGYYAMVAERLGASESLGIDNDFSGMGYAKKVNGIAKALRLKNTKYLDIDVNAIDGLPQVDIVANVGGLYHVSNPLEILEKSYDMAKKYLIVQTVVTLENNKSGYFESPAPGWTWGCRFSRKYIEKAIKDRGYKVIDSHFNELKGNSRPEDKGSVYFLIEKT